MAEIGYDEEKRQYFECKTTLEVFIVTEKMNSLAGFVTVDVGGWLGHGEKRDVFQIERCPDRAATLRMKLLCRYMSENTPRQLNDTPTYPLKDYSTNGASEYAGKTDQLVKRGDVQSSKNKEFM